MGRKPAHGRAAERRTGLWLTVAVVVVALAAAGAGAALYVHDDRGGSAAATPPPAIVPLDVVGTNPATGATDVAPSTAITVDLSTPLAPGSALPFFSPPVDGNWSELSASELQFVADGPLVPGTQYTMTLPGGPTGMLAADGQRLGSTVTVTFSVAAGSTLRLQQLLAQLGYLPVSFAPASQPTSPQQEADPQEGTWSWRWPNLPAALTSLWTPGSPNVITKGAVMAFETQHGLATTGTAGPATWADLLQAAAKGATDPQPYDYVYVSKTLPETATVYQNGSQVYSTPANTGVPAAPTATGTFPVYARYRVTTMSGTNPDGSHYVDPGIPWVSYFNGGDALHGFPRSHYGYPQSVGCVEMPPDNAAVVWPLTPLGTLVTVAP
ncbi:MAG TPA: L,D-transpeptidase family protein [Acidimicrobiales bacterium]|nr:L,D-transpeptidase family protein [Acidimicrobiales bacterium]